MLVSFDSHYPKQSTKQYSLTSKSTSELIFKKWTITGHKW